MLNEDRGVGECIGRGYDNDGCGFTGRQSGDVCPECGGMILSRKSQQEAAIIAAKLELAEEIERASGHKKTDPLRRRGRKIGRKANRRH